MTSEGQAAGKGATENGWVKYSWHSHARKKGRQLVHCAAIELHQMTQDSWCSILVLIV